MNWFVLHNRNRAAGEGNGWTGTNGRLEDYIRCSMFTDSSQAAPRGAGNRSDAGGVRAREERNDVLKPAASELKT
jgi:hypothetical protein